jgi:hypothetical protein
LTVAEAIAAYWRHAKTYYRSADGRPSSEFGGIKAAFRPILRLYGRQPVAEFGLLALKVIREEFVQAELSRSTINQHIGRIRHAYRHKEHARGSDHVPPKHGHAGDPTDGVATGLRDSSTHHPVAGEHRGEC